MSTITAKERPVIFSGPMVKAILDGRKTQTRRVIKPQPETYAGESGPQFEWPNWHGSLGAEGFARHCPYGQPGERLWVRETFRAIEDPGAEDSEVRRKYRDDDGETHYIVVDYRADAPTRIMDQIGKPEWKPSIRMPRWASRITLEITEVRVERLQSITEEDAKAEGFDVDLCGQVLRQAAGKARMDFARWLELPDGSEPDGYWCLDCVDKEAKKQGARVCGWNDCFENDHAPRCEKCGVMLHHSLTRYGIETELGLTDEDDTRIFHTPAEGDSALALAEVAEGMGDWSEEYAGRLAQIGFATLWDRLNANRGQGWAANPWVWCISFRRLESPS